MKRVLVTGANGQLGTSVEKVAKNYPDLEFNFKTSSQLDITKVNKIKSLFKAGNFDYCINCAAYTNVEQAEKTPKIAFEVNAEAVKNLALACLAYKVILIHISTDYVFDGQKEGPYTVNDMPNPINEYGKSKLQGEKYIQEILKPYYIIRTSWLYSEFGDNFYTKILKKASNEKVLYITDSQIGCPTNAINLANFLIEKIVLSILNFGIHHFSDGEAMTWFDFAQKILEKNQMNTVVEAHNYSTFAARPKNSILQ